MLSILFCLGSRPPGALFVLACASRVTGPCCCPYHCSHAFYCSCRYHHGHQDSLCPCCSWGVGISVPRAGGRGGGALAAQCSVASVPESLALPPLLPSSLPQPREGARIVGTDVAAALFLLRYGLVGWGQSHGPHLPSPLRWLWLSCHGRSHRAVGTIPAASPGPPPPRVLTHHLRGAGVGLSGIRALSRGIFIEL